MIPTAAPAFDPAALRSLASLASLASQATHGEHWGMPAPTRPQPRP